MQGEAVDRSNEFEQLGSGGLLNICGAIINQATVFATVVMIGHQLGSRSVGLYTQAFALRSIASLVCMGGMRNAMTRYVAVFLANKDAAAVRGTIRAGLWAAALAAAAASAGIFLNATTIAHKFFDDADLAVGIGYSALSLIPATVMVGALSACQGFRTMRAYAIIGSILEPCLRFACAVVSLSFGFGVDGALFGLVLASTISCGASLWALHRLSSGLPHAPPRYPLAEIGRYSLYSWFSSVANQGLLYADTLILGAYLPSTDVGVYSVASRAILLGSVAVTPLAASFAPRAADLWERHMLANLRRVFVVTSEWLFISALPLTIAVFVFPYTVLGIFGSGFGQGAIVIQILAAGALFDAWGTAAGVTLNMLGRNNLNMFDSIGVLAVNIGLNLMLIPRYGIAGAAFAWSASLVLYAVVRIVQIRYWVLHVVPASKRLIKASVAAGLAFMCGTTVKSVIGDTLAGAAMGAILLFATFGTVLTILGIDADDRSLLSPVLARMPQRSSKYLDNNVKPSLTQRTRANVSLGVRTLARLRPRSNSGQEPIPVASLISPLRYDVMVRAEFFDFIERSRDVWSRDVNKFIDLSKQTSYYIWFRNVAVHHIHNGIVDENTINRSFALRVHKTLELFRRYEASGFDERWPITVNKASQLQTEAGKNLTPRFQPTDGCHRLALLWRNGVTVLSPQQYHVKPAPQWAIDNTASLIGVLALGANAYCEFIAHGYGVSVANHPTPLEELKDLLSPSQYSEALKIIAIDMPSLTVDKMVPFG